MNTEDRIDIKHPRDNSMTSGKLKFFHSICLLQAQYSYYFLNILSSQEINDLPFPNTRFANGFGADARRKRHTADSGYGSEQPLDRRWSQDFSQDVSI